MRLSLLIRPKRVSRIIALLLFPLAIPVVAAGNEPAPVVDFSGASRGLGTNDQVQTEGVILASFTAPTNIKKLVDVTGVGSGIHSSVAIQLEELSAPEAPTSLVAVAVGDGQITLHWQPADLLHTGFIIERREIVGGDWVEAGTTDHVAQFTDTGLEKVVSYHYRVRAISPAGPSGWSGTAGATAFQEENRDLVAWGSNLFGQLGDGTAGMIAAPTRVGEDVDWQMVSAGLNHVAALREDGTLWTWGSNAAKQLGFDDGAFVDEPRQVGMDTDWQSVSTGNSHTIALKEDGSLWTWGNGNWEGVRVPGDHVWVQVNTYRDHNLAIRSDHSLWAWGNNFQGKLGISRTASAVAEPTRVGTETDWIEAVAGSSHSVGLRADGSLWTWGSNQSGQLGIGATSQQVSHSAAPVRVGSGEDWVGIATGEEHGFAVKANGEIWGWGRNSSGRIGSGLTLVTAPIKAQNGDYLVASAGGNHSLAIDADDRAWSWGGNEFGQLGTGSRGGSNTSRQAVFGDATWRGVSAGWNYSLGIRTDGSLWSWGNGNQGRLGIAGVRTSRLFAEAVETGGWIRIAAGRNHALGIRGDGSLWAWGQNNRSQLGEGTRVQRLSPILIDADRYWTTVAAGAESSMALTENGQLWRWGSKGSTMAAIPEFYSDGWRTIASGSGHALAIREDGTLWAWGSGYLGNSNTQSSFIWEPEQVGSEANWSAISAGLGFSLAVDGNGHLWAWGRNIGGQLGLGGTGSEPWPRRVMTHGARWVNVAAGGDHSAGVRSDGSLWTWGRWVDSSGWLQTFTSPQRVGTDGDWAEVAAGDGWLDGRISDFFLGRKRDGTLWQWRAGWNPARISDDTSWGAIAVGSNHLMALRASSLDFPPPGLSVSETRPGAITLQWTADAASLHGFLVEREWPGGGWERIGSTAAVEASYIDTTAPPGTVNNYRILGYAGSTHLVSSQTLAVASPITYWQWMEGLEGERLPPANQRGPEDAPARDNIPNLLKFLFGADPLTQARAILPRANARPAFEEEDSAPAIEFVRWLPAWGTTPELLVSTDLQNWHPVEMAMEVLESLPDGRERVRVRQVQNPDTETRKIFLRLQITLSGQ